MKKKRGIGGVIVLVLLVVVIVGAFVIVMRLAPRSAEDKTEVSELDTLLNIDVTGNYPPTPREVMKLYNRYIICLYGSASEITDGQMQALGAKLREMYDTELLNDNPQEENLDNLAQELNGFKSTGKLVIQANVCGSNEVDYVDLTDGSSGAFVEVSYFMRYDQDPKEKFKRTYQKFLLRKDANGDWKILGFEQVDKPAKEVE